jgi:ornithine decarboxylase
MAAVAQVRLRAAMAVDVLRHAQALGLDAYGVSFHVGSQQCDLSTPGTGARRRQGASSRRWPSEGIVLKMVNMGGGFPTKYLKDVPAAQ